MIKVEPRITTLLLSYKRPILLDRAIRSVLKQTFKNLKVSIFDNASNDNTVDVIKKHVQNDNRVEALYRENNIGFQKNLKHALSTISTEYFSILCDDDLLSCNFYDKAINILDSNLDIDFVVLDTLFFNENVDFINKTNCNNKTTFFSDDDKYLIFHNKKIPITITGIVFRKKVSFLYGSIHEEYDLGGDIRFTFLAAAKYNFAHFSSVGAFVYLHENEISVNRNTFNPIERVIQMERYAEVYYDEDVSPKTKIMAKNILIKMLNTSYQKLYFKMFLTSYISCYLMYSDNNMKVINNYYDYLNENNKSYLISIYKTLFYNKVLKALIYPLLSFLRIIKHKRLLRYKLELTDNKINLINYYNEILEIQRIDE